MKRSGRWVAFAALACLWVFAAPSTLQAADGLQERAMKACKEDIVRNNPVWSADRTEQICDCRNRFLWAKHSKQDISLIVEAEEKNELVSVPERLTKDDLRYIGICMDDVSARPEDFSDR